MLGHKAVLTEVWLQVALVGTISDDGLGAKTPGALGSTLVACVGSLFHTRNSDEKAEEIWNPLRKM